MKLQEQLATLRTLERRHREALRAMVLNEVRWNGPYCVARHPGSDRREMIRVGMVDWAEPFVIVQHIDAAADVTVATAEEVAAWTWHAVYAFPALADFLRKAGAKPSKPESIDAER